MQLQCLAKHCSIDSITVRPRERSLITLLTVKQILLIRKKYDEELSCDKWEILVSTVTEALSWQINTLHH